MESRYNDVSKIGRFLLWFAAWVAALILTVAKHPFSPWAIIYVPFFPLGLSPGFDWKPDFYHMLCWVSGWVLYALLTVAALTTRRHIGYFTLYAVLVVLLIWNANGCRELLPRIAHEPLAR